MNTPNPLIPQGAIPGSNLRLKANFRIVVSVVVLIHVFIIVGMLMQGCKQGNVADGQETLPSLPGLTNNKYYSDPAEMEPEVSSSEPVIIPEPVPSRPLPPPPAYVSIMENYRRHLWTVAKFFNNHRDFVCGDHAFHFFLNS